MPHKLQVLVRIDSDLERAHIQVRGTVTTRNVQALFAIVGRAGALLPGKEVIMDLGSARSEQEALTDLRAAAHRKRLPSGTASGDSPCRLLVLEPAAA